MHEKKAVMRFETRISIRPAGVDDEVVKLLGSVVETVAAPSKSQVAPLALLFW
jgi:hypothetical protein